MDDRPLSDLPRTTLQLMALGLLIAATLWIVRPFLPAMMWAGTLVVATWPLLLRAEAVFGGRRSFAVALMTVALLLMLVVPLSLGIDAIVSNTDLFVEWAGSLSTMSIPHPPAWLASIPIVGDRIVERWNQLASQTPDEVASSLVPYARASVLWLALQIGSMGLLVVQFLLTVVVAALLYANGEAAAAVADRLARRLAGPQGHDALVLAAQAVRGVALGVVLTALIQTTLVGVGLALVGVPFASILVGVTFVICVAQIGPFLVLIPVIAWVYSVHGTLWGIVFLVWSMFCGLLDNFVRPVLIRRGADIPLVLIFTGVIGGLLAVGVIGLFIGPVVLAVAWTLLMDWAYSDPNASPDEARS